MTPLPLATKHNLYIYFKVQQLSVHMTTCASEQLARDRRLRAGAAVGRGASVHFILLLTNLEGKCVKVCNLLLKLLLKVQCWN